VAGLRWAEGKQRKRTRPGVQGAAANFGEIGLKQKQARIGRKEKIKEKGFFLFLKSNPTK
jgi:hypothetical protein